MSHVLNDRTVSAALPTKASTVSAVIAPMTTDTPFATVAQSAPAMAEPQVPMRAKDLSPDQRARLLVRCAESVFENRFPTMPRDIDLKEFLALFNRDSTVDHAASSALYLRDPAKRHSIAIIIAHDCKL